jgi:hypothetical protein
LPLFAKRHGERVLVTLAALRFDGDLHKPVPSAVLTAFAEALLGRESL